MFRSVLALLTALFTSDNIYLHGLLDVSLVSVQLEEGCRISKAPKRNGMTSNLTPSSGK